VYLSVNSLIILAAHNPWRDVSYTVQCIGLLCYC